MRDAGPGALAVDAAFDRVLLPWHHVAAEGSGIGLLMSKRVAELNDAQLTLSIILGSRLEANLEWALLQKLIASVEDGGNRTGLVMALHQINAEPCRSSAWPFSTAVAQWNGQARE